MPCQPEGPDRVLIQVLVFRTGGHMRCRGTARLFARRCASSTSTAAPAHEVHFKHVDCTNFYDAKVELAEALQRAAFVSLDCEFTGLDRERQHGKTMLQSSNERYTSLRKALVGKGLGSRRFNRRQGYLIVQVGLSCFEWCEVKRRYEVKSYSFYLSPRPMSRLTGNVKVEHDLHFGCMASALKFLSTHGFDFNKWLNHGVPFMSRAAYVAERDKLDIRRAHSDDDLEEARGFLEIWDTLIAARKPLVGHQCLLDFLYLWNQLEGPLPSSLSQFIRSLSSKISLAIDTKHIISAYPKDLVVVLEDKITRLRDERLRTARPDLAEKEASCKRILKHLSRGSSGLKTLTLTELYSLSEPLMKEVMPVMSASDLIAHDAGADSYMTGVVYACLHSLLHMPGTPPTSEFILRNHTKRNTAHPAIGSPRSFTYSNKLHVFASPFSYNTVSAVPTIKDTHENTIVIVPPFGGLLDCNRITQLLSSCNPHADLFWVEFQRVAVVNLYRREGDAADVVAAFKKEVLPYRWEVHTAMEWREKTRPPKAGKKKRDKAKRLRWLRNKLRASKGANMEMNVAVNRLQDVKQQSAQRLQELMDAQRDLKKLQGMEKALQDAENNLQSSKSTLSKLQKKQEQLKENNSSTEAGKEALEKKSEALSRGLENYKQQADALRIQLADAVSRTERVERDLKDAQVKQDVAEMAAAEATAKLARVQATKQTRENSQQANQDNEKILKMKQQRAAKQAETPRDRKFKKNPVQDDSSNTAPRKLDHTTTKKTSTVVEQRSGQWLIEKKEGKKDAPLDISLVVEKKHLTLEMRDAKHVRVFINGTVGSVTFTSCEHVHIFCEATVTEPSKTWSWKDTQRVSGPRIFYYGSDKGNIKIDVLPKEKWPDRKGSETHIAARVKKDLNESVKKKVRQLDVMRSIVFFITIAMVFQIILTSMATPPHLAGQGNKLLQREREDK